MLDNEIGFFSMLLREIKKGPKELFARLEKWLDEIFGYGQKVGDNALTEAQKNAKKLQDARELKRKRIEEARQDRQRMTNKSDGGQKFKKPVLQKMIKELEEKYQTPLFDRMNRQIYPTKKAHLLYNHSLKCSICHINYQLYPC